MTLRLFPKHAGVWEGTYTRLDPAGNVTNHFKSRLSIRLFNGNQYHQVNQYFWDDGHEEFHDFGICQFNDAGLLIFDNPRIYGESWETRDSICLVWTYLNRPGSKLFEMIDLIGDGTHRVRNWRWTENDLFQGITMIDERKVATADQIDPLFWENTAARRTLGPSRSDR